MPSNVCTPAATKFNRYMILLLAFLIFCLPVYGLKLFLFKYVNKRSELIHNDFRIVDIYRYLLKIHQPLNFSSPQPAALVTAPRPPPGSPHLTSWSSSSQNCPFIHQPSDCVANCRQILSTYLFFMLIVGKTGLFINRYFNPLKIIYGWASPTTCVEIMHGNW